MRPLILCLFLFSTPAYTLPYGYWFNEFLAHTSLWIISSWSLRVNPSLCPQGTTAFCCSDEGDLCHFTAGECSAVWQQQCLVNRFLPIEAGSEEQQNSVKAPEALPAEPIYDVLGALGTLGIVVSTGIYVCYLAIFLYGAESRAVWEGVLRAPTWLFLTLDAVIGGLTLIFSVTVARDIQTLLKISGVGHLLFAALRFFFFKFPACYSVLKFFYERGRVLPGPHLPPGLGELPL